MIATKPSKFLIIRVDGRVLSSISSYCVFKESKKREGGMKNYRSGLVSVLKTIYGDNPDGW